jgi:acyl carrier protein
LRHHVPVLEPTRTRAETGAAVRKFLLGHLETPRNADDLPDDLPLGDQGLGLDSIAVVEVLLECEERWDISPLALIEGPPLRIGDVVDHFAVP